MKHVFVETNVLVDLLRPSPSKDADALYARNDNVDLRLYVPWCSQSEAWRTLNRVISDDLGFVDAMMRFAVRRWTADRTLFEKVEIDKLRALAKADHAAALTTLATRIQATMASVAQIDPTPTVVARTLQIFTVKALKPFDEMVLGAVLSKASELFAAGERELYFCNLDGDLASQHSALAAEYGACGLTVRQDFNVP